MKEFEDRIRTFLEERGWENLRPADLAKSVMIEGAELLELFQWENKSLEDVKQDEAKLQEIRGELADVMIYCFDMAVTLGIDVEAMLEEKLEKAKEKYPVEFFNAGTHKKEEPGTEEAYRSVKEKHRKGI